MSTEDPNRQKRSLNGALLIAGLVVAALLGLVVNQYPEHCLGAVALSVIDVFAATE